jgi:hypothetical protein
MLWTELCLIIGVEIKGCRPYSKSDAIEPSFEPSYLIGGYDVPVDVQVIMFFFFFFNVKAPFFLLPSPASRTVLFLTSRKQH